jgi:hypothetical protein
MHMKRLFLLAVGFAACFVPAPVRADSEDHRYYYLRSSAAPPWDVTNNEVDMDDVFGQFSWRNRTFETVTISRLFSPSTAFIFMEGGDNNSNALSNFLTTYNSQLQSWVAGGGRLFINAAPNQGSNINMGFGITLNFNGDDYSTGSDNGFAVDPNHPIFADNLQPVGISFSGGDAFSHGYLTGSGFNTILQDDQSRPVLVELRYGAGLVLIGGMTMDIFQSPWPNTHNLRTNIIWYTATAQLN